VRRIIYTTDEIDKRYFVTSSGTSPSMFFGSTASLVFFRPDRRFHSRRAQGQSRLAAFYAATARLGLDWPEQGGMLRRIGRQGARGLAHWKYSTQAAMVVVRGRPRGEVWCIG
jgi:hypothetical protein